MKAIVTLLGIIFMALANQCATTGSYELIIGRSYFSSRIFEGALGHQSFGKAKKDSLVEIRGIYASQKIYIQEYPIIRWYDKNRGKKYVPLSSDLDIEEGTLIQLKGRVISQPITYKLLKKTYYYNFLEPLDFKKILNTGELLEKVDAEYARLRAQLQEKITPENSKLQLSLNPDWEVWWCKNDGTFIVSTRMYDLMYEANIEFVFDGNSRKLKYVFAREWFKGEME